MQRYCVQCHNLPNPAMHKTALREGVAAIVQKPFSAKELYALVAAHTHGQ